MTNINPRIQQYQPQVQNESTIDTNVSTSEESEQDQDQEKKTAATRAAALLADTSMRKRYRFIMLFLNSLVLVGPYFCYDNPGALEVQIEEMFQIKT